MILYMQTKKETIESIITGGAGFIKSHSRQLLDKGQTYYV